MALAPLMPGTLLRYAGEIDRVIAALDVVGLGDAFKSVTTSLRREADQYANTDGSEMVEVEAEYFDQLMHRSSRMFALEKRLADLQAEIDRHNERTEDPLRVPEHLTRPLPFPEYR
jgi:chemotaxis protein histidine kinase CheA